MINVNIEYYEYQSTPFGHGYRTMYADGVNGKQYAVDSIGMNPVDFIEVAVKEVVKTIIANNGANEAITVNLPAEIVLSAGLQTHISEKFMADPLVTSLTFS